MKFTVLIPLYNKAAYIRCTIDSVLAQTRSDFEVLVVNDGSTDGGDQIVQAITDPRLRLIHQANAGVSAARNHGIAQARGDWVVFLDADDWQHPDFLAALVLAQATFPEAKTVATDFVRVSDSEGQWPPDWEPPAGQPEIELISDLPLRWMSGPSLCSSAAAVQRTLLLAMQPCFPVGETVGEDLDLWFRLAEKAPVALVRRPLAAYRVEVEGSLTSQHTPMVVPPFLQRMQQRALSGQLTPAQRRSALWMVAQHHVTMSRQAVAQGQRLQGLRWLQQGRHAARGGRWWLSLAMALLVPRQLVNRWQHWRVRRSSPQTPMKYTGRAHET